jgi:hypothetical protein
MKNVFITHLKNLGILLLIVGLSSCGEDSDMLSESIDCGTDVAGCLTDGGRQTYSNYSSDGVPTTNDCFKSIQMGFNMDGTFTWSSDSDTDNRCLELIGFPNYTGQWTLENNGNEIHITPPWFTNNGQTKTVLEIISLDERDLKAMTPNQTGAKTEIIWRRI